MSIDQDLIKTLKQFFILFLVSLLVCLMVFIPVASSKTKRHFRHRSNSINSFEEVSERAVLDVSDLNNERFSIAWVDFNGDGYQDLWLSSHFYRDFGGAKKRPKLYLNQGGNSFVDITSTVWPVIPEEIDSHGTSWADFDNDGDPDLLVSTGSVRGTGQNDNALFRNDSGRLFQTPGAMGLSYPLDRGRSPLWFDRNRDGLLDVVLAAAARPDGLAPTAYFEQMPDHQFVDKSTALKFHVPLSAGSAQVTDSTGDGLLDLLVQGIYRYPLKAFDFSSQTFLSLAKSLFPFINDPPSNPNDVYGGDTSAPKDAAIADFNGDLHPDIFLPRSLMELKSSRLFKTADEKLASATFFLKKVGEVGAQFQTSGSFYFDAFNRINSNLSPSQIFIGSAGIHPSEIGTSLSPDNSENWGIAPHTPGTDVGIYLGYDQLTQVWSIFFSGLKNQQERILIEADNTITQFTPINFTQPNPSAGGFSPLLLLYQSEEGKYIKIVDGGLTDPIPGMYAVAGDFDNDMDVDIFVTCGTGDFPVSNVLYRNTGNGTFTMESDASGAAGKVTGPHDLDFSWGKKVAIADYDNDGFLDIYTSQTELKTTGRRYIGAPAQLFHNLNNGNHWLQINLKGTLSNQDGIGATVLATAGGITQYREQSGGMHTYGQNQQRVHFGMGQNTQIDTLEIRWPSGVTQTLNDIPADTIMTITEPNGTAKKRQKKSVRKSVRRGKK